MSTEKPAVTAKPTVAAKPAVAVGKVTSTTSGAKNVVATPVKAPAFKIRSAEERAKERYLKILIYGDYGVGKTYLAGTAVGVPQMRDVLILSAEGGELTYDSSEDFDFSPIDSIKVDTFEQASKVFDFLKMHCEWRDKATEEATESLRKLEAKFHGKELEDIKEPKRYRTVIIDSLTEVEKYFMNHLLGINASTGLAETSATAEFKEYKLQNSALQRFVRFYRDLPMNVIFICGRQYDKDDSQRMLFMPDMTGKLSSQIQGFVDIVGYLVTGMAESGQIQRQLNVQPAGRYSAKCRLSNYKKPAWSNPTMGGILKDTGLLLETETKPTETETKTQTTKE